MKTLSPKQQQIYDYIVSFSGLHGYPPSVREIGEAVGLKSPSTVHFHLKGLEAAGLITKAEGKTRAITISGPHPGAPEPAPHPPTPPLAHSAACSGLSTPSGTPKKCEQHHGMASPIRAGESCYTSLLAHSTLYWVRLSKKVNATRRAENSTAAP